MLINQETSLRVWLWNKEDLFMIDLEKYNDQPEFKAALKEMFSSLDDSIIDNPII